jgi:uncharacterized membrane protein
MVSLWGARSLAAIFGAVSIPAIYGLSWLAFRSRLVSHLAAAMMAISPYGIFLAQEARHYTLAILWVIASFACLVVTARHIQKHTQLPIWLVFSWVGINALGIATHYFFALTLCTEAVVLIFLAWQQWKQGNKGTRIKGQGAIEEVPKIPNPQSPIPNAPPWRRIYAVAVGTFIASIIWIPVFLHNTHGNKLTDWIQGDRIGLAWISPIFQAIAAWITMISLLPVESPQLLVVIISGLVMIIFFIWAIPILVHGLKILFVQSQTRLITQVFVSIILAAIALFFCFTYFFGIDLTRGARYNFVYFPAVIVLVGASLAICWNTPLKKKGGVREWGKGTWRVNGKMVVAIIWVMGLASAITVVCNLGYQKYYRPDLFIQLIQKTSQVPALIATTQKTHVQIGEMMGVAREFKLQNSLSSTSSILPLFFLAHQDQDPNTSTTALQSTLKLLPRPFDLWLVNFYAPEPEAIKNCIAETRSLPAVNGYEYKIYHCNS